MRNKNQNDESVSISAFNAYTMVFTSVVFEFDRLVGKVASDNSHKWVYSDSQTENDPTFISSWNVSIEPVRKYLSKIHNLFHLHFHCLISFCFQ